MSFTFAPSRLVLAPRPLPSELISSWMLRVAAANHVSLEELLSGLRAHSASDPSDQSILDYALSQAAHKSWARFCRVPLEAIQAMDLRARAPQLETSLVLQFRIPSRQDSRVSARRAKYTFCPTCIACQQVVHIPWQWSLACLTLCPVHRTPLQDRCPECGEPDPLTFTSPDRPPQRTCWSCTGNLTTHSESMPIDLDRQSIDTVEDAYCAAILGTAPDRSLVGKTTDRAFRTFIIDLLQALSAVLNPTVSWPARLTADADIAFRRNLLHIIAELISNAAPTSDTRLVLCPRSSVR